MKALYNTPVPLTPLKGPYEFRALGALGCSGLNLGILQRLQHADVSLRCLDSHILSCRFFGAAVQSCIRDWIVPAGSFAFLISVITPH